MDITQSINRIVFFYDTLINLDRNKFKNTKANPNYALENKFFTPHRFKKKTNKILFTPNRFSKKKHKKKFIKY